MYFLTFHKLSIKKLCLLSFYMAIRIDFIRLYPVLNFPHFVIYNYLSNLMLII